MTEEFKYNLSVIFITVVLTFLVTTFLLGCCASRDTRDKDLLYSCREYDLLKATDSTLLVLPKEGKPYIINIK